ncbi:flagellar hook-basal body protein [Thermotoga profunda]|uniref:flagellar hook-basal body protein n=1 Tax=Thermotoga profunda TaxID=1508420 RepID=UPI0005975074|nr:flagellar hook-basal body protein [Thermotoga profunda]
MIRGIYTAAMGMLLDTSKVDTTANNLANIETVGYKKDKLIFRAYQDRAIYALPNRKHPIGNLTYSAVLDDVYLDTSHGTFLKTDNPLDLAIESDGYFALQGENSVYYTKAGNFKLDAEGYIVNADGLRLLDENGEAIQFLDGYSVDQDGYIKDRFNNIVTRIGVYTFENQSQLRKIGYTLLQPTPQSGEAVAEEDFRILPGYVELSNVNALLEMTKLIEAQRHFEISQKVVVVEDELLAKLTSQVGSLR